MKRLSIVIGRFQVPNLHKGHIHLISEAEKRADLLLIMIGCRTEIDANNPMDYTVRRAMIKEVFPKAYTIALFDQIDRNGNFDDKKWTREIDSLLTMHLNDYRMTLYGSRDSFKENYHGIIPYVHIDSVEEESGTDLRKRITPIVNADFRSGIIYAVQKYLNQQL